MARTPEVPVSGKVLEWARRQRGLTIPVAAKRLGITEDRVAEIETGDRRPSLAQLRKMSEVYKRPLIVLLLDEPPKTFQPLADYRSLPEADRGDYSPQLLDEIRRAEQQQEIYSELSSELGLLHETAVLPKSTQSPDDLAKEIRFFLQVTYPEQQRWTSPQVAYNEWRSRVESKGILVLEASRVDLSEMRGFSLSERQPFVIVVNGQDSPRGKVFTLLHELAHLCSRQAGICDLHPYGRPGSQDTEIYCNAVAGEALLPKGILTGLEVVQQHTPGQRWADEELTALESIAGGASQEAILRRLLDMGLASRTEYEERRKEFQEKYQEYRRARNSKSKGGPPPHRMQLRDRGKPFIRSVLHAYAEGIVSLSDVADLAGVRVKHLDKMQKEAFR